jgi:hypothetical protein
MAKDIFEEMEEDALETTVASDADLKTLSVLVEEQEAYRWLTDHGHGDLIKSEVSVLFGKEELENAEKLMKKLEKDGYSFDSKQSVHASTLKSWLAGQVEAAEPVPLELFGAFLGQVATIKKGR